MSGPWENYQAAPADSGKPWEKYGAPPPAAPAEPLSNSSDLLQQGRAAYSQKVAQGDESMPGTTEGHGMLGGLAEWDKASGGEIAGGVSEILKGNVSVGLHRIISGAGATLSPAAPIVAAGAPLAAAGSAVGGLAGDAIAKGGAEALGATPDQAQLAGDIGGIAGGIGGAKVPDMIPSKVVTAPVRLGARAAETAINQKFLPIKKLVNLMTTADQAEKLNIKVPGRDFGLESPEAPNLAPRYRDATLNKRNIPEYAGDEIPDTPPPTPPGQFSFQADAKSLASLKQATTQLVDSAVPSSTNHGVNLMTKAQIDMKLRAGDVSGAEQILDNAAKKVTPGYMAPERPEIVPATQNIRENEALSANAQQKGRTGGYREAQDDAGVSQEMRGNLDRHGVMAEQEARREFIARNSLGTTKGEMAQQVTTKAVDSSKLTLQEKLQLMLDAARAAKQ